MFEILIGNAIFSHLLFCPKTLLKGCYTLCEKSKLRKRRGTHVLMPSQRAEIAELWTTQEQTSFSVGLLLSSGGLLTHVEKNGLEKSKQTKQTWVRPFKNIWRKRGLLKSPPDWDKKKNRFFFLWPPLFHNLHKKRCTWSDLKHR